MVNVLRWEAIRYRRLPDDKRRFGLQYPCLCFKEGFSCSILEIRRRRVPDTTLCGEQSMGGKKRNPERVASESEFGAKGDFYTRGTSARSLSCHRRLVSYAGRTRAEPDIEVSKGPGNVL